MHQRFVRFPTLGIGFSGEDLQYDPNYLSIRPSVSEGRSSCSWCESNRHPFHCAR
jgi:hypothetical protein